MRADQIERIREFLASESFERLLGQVHDDIEDLLAEWEADGVDRVLTPVDPRTIELLWPEVKP